VAEERRAVARSHIAVKAEDRCGRQGFGHGAERSTPKGLLSRRLVDIHTTMTARRPGIRICSRRAAWRHHGGGNCGVGFAPVKVEDRQRLSN